MPIGQNDEYTRVAKLFVSKVFLILVHFFNFYTLNPNDVRGNVKEGEKRTGLTEKLPAAITLFRLPPTRRIKNLRHKIQNQKSFFTFQRTLPSLNNATLTQKMRASVIYIHNGTGILSVKKKRRRRIRRWFPAVCLKRPFTKESNNLIATEVAILILKYEIIETSELTAKEEKRHTRTRRERVHESPCTRDLTPPFRMMTRRSQAFYAVPTLRVYHCSLEEHIYLFPGYPFGGSKRFAFVSSLTDNAYFCNRSKPEMYSSPGSRFIRWVLLSRQRAAAWEAGNGNLNGLVRKYL